MADKFPAPTLVREEALWSAGVRSLAGIDEAGRGALAGPVAAAAVVLPAHAKLAGVWTQVRDSKLLSPGERETLESLIQCEAAAWAIGSASAEEVDRFGVAAATRKAMTVAIRALSVEPEHLLIDWVRLPDVSIGQSCWAKADRDSVSVAAASILAKVWRDRLLIEMDAVYPAYGFAAHKGYGTAAHRAALALHGPCAAHRRTFAPVAQCRSLFDTRDSSGAPATAPDASGRHDVAIARRRAPRPGTRRRRAGARRASGCRADGRGAQLALSRRRAGHHRPR